MITKTIVVLLCHFVFATSHQISFRPCPASSGTVVTPKSVDISPCPEEPCTIAKGANASVSITFEAQDNHTGLTVAIYGIIAGIPVKFQMPNSDGCRESGINCPITNGNTYTYKSAFAVKKEYPVIDVIVMWRIDGINSNNESKNDFCCTFPVKITN